MAQWSEQKPPTSVTRVQIPVSTQYVRVSMGLTVSRQKRLFFTVNRQKCTVILTVKAFQGIQLIFTDFWLLKNLFALKTTSHVVKNTLSEHCKTVQLCYILKYLDILYVKGQDNLQNTIKY